MRIIIGYAAIALLTTLCIFLLIGTQKEYQRITSFNEALSAEVGESAALPRETSFLTDRYGKRFSKASPDFRLYAEGEDLPEFLKEMTVYSEDRNFYDHIGIDAGAILRAVVKNLVFTHIEQGGSTITQQLARNLYLTQEKTYSRKLTEMVYAYKLEQSMTKDQILESYLNNIYYSNGIFGVRSAAFYYFQKGLSEMTDAQLAFLAAIPNNPEKYDPVKHFDAAKDRQERLLDLMAEEKNITATEADKIKSESIALDLYEDADLYPDYAVYVEKELMDLISMSEGYTERIEKALSQEEKSRIFDELSARTRLVLDSGITIQTALDPALQEKSVSSLRKHLPYKKVEGASVIIRNDTREIVSVTGGKNYQKYNFNRSYQAVRQPGSTIKPLLVYAPYIEQYRPLLSQLVKGHNYCTESYCPENYGGAVYGKVTLSQAFTQSLNTPAIWLLDQLGIQPGFDYMKPYRFKHLVKDDYSLAAAVGGFTYGMTPLELTDAYTGFIDGTYSKSHAIQSVKNKAGDVLYEWPAERKEIWSAETTEKMRELLSAAATSGTARPAFVHKPYAGIKTGTTNQFLDFWTMGLTDQYTAGVWVGHDLPKSMEGIELDRPAQHIWRDMMK
ncbi:penicillin-binding protein [Jeotgalibacillus sp. S-D1]|uniref:transglycosylase domain-containing protein n=1 Tax=Jeotgalibacillus sp. S-D1 TaxID=2552189 RepID=UPI001059B1DD|nr:transglycosylase domain-containing protein [Jeotgalibacillus sp. S-D1]TDL30375.1 penicillin-binding protein [Jeotgalibacillus sp. S-D1]